MEWLLIAGVGIVSIVLWLVAFDPNFNGKTRWQCFILASVLMIFEVCMFFLHIGGWNNA